MFYSNKETVEFYITSLLRVERINGNEYAIFIYALLYYEIL